MITSKHNSKGNTTINTNSTTTTTTNHTTNFKVVHQGRGEKDHRHNSETLGTLRIIINMNHRNELFSYKCSYYEMNN